MAMPDAFRELAAKVNNWGRWGDADEVGTLNLVDAAAVRRGAQCVRTGRSFPLGLPLRQDGVQIGNNPGRINPLRTMVLVNEPLTGDRADFCSSDDVVVMGLQAATHWDALAHVSYEGRLYNGFPADSITVHGAAHCGIDKVSTINGRGVLLDVARTLGVDRLPDGHAITGAELDAAAEAAKVVVEPGDVLLVRTGQMTRQLAGDTVGYNGPGGGLSLRSVEWLREHDVAAVATDNLIFEVFPCEREDAFLPVHLLHLVEMGLTQGQNWNMEELSADCADDGVYAFWLEASPQPFAGALGSPVNPVAVK